MKKLLLAAGLTLALLVSGCGTTGPIITSDTVTSTVAQVQEQAQRVCNFLPTAASVANILATMAGYGDVAQTISSVASSICTAVLSKSALRGAAPKVNGVKVRGRFVR